MQTNQLSHHGGVCGQPHVLLPAEGRHQLLHGRVEGDAVRLGDAVPDLGRARVVVLHRGQAVGIPAKEGRFRPITLNMFYKGHFGD